MRQTGLYKSSRITLLSYLVSQLEYSLLNPCFSTDRYQIASVKGGQNWFAAQRHHYLDMDEKGGCVQTSKNLKIDDRGTVTDSKEARRGPP
jgi:hypothetical protein